ncbi:hypothetical protein F5880DRAFT_1609333 [Lentinula raphanica]|nr:hypothetical protein F5880DRAFT_1609333 [Lentinula raphanica]
MPPEESSHPRLHPLALTLIEARLLTGSQPCNPFPETMLSRQSNEESGHFSLPRLPVSPLPHLLISSLPRLLVPSSSLSNASTPKAYAASRRPAPHLGKALLAAAATAAASRIGNPTLQRDTASAHRPFFSSFNKSLGADEPLGSTLTLRQNPPPTSPIRLELAANFLLRNLSISTSPRTSSCATYPYRLRRERPPMQPICLEPTANALLRNLTVFALSSTHLMCLRSLYTRSLLLSSQYPYSILSTVPY